MRDNEISGEIVKSVFDIHNEIGPGLLESAYEKVLVYELRRKGLNTYFQVPIPIIIRGIAIEESYRADIIVEDLVIIELKSVELLHPVHFKQLLTYLRLSDIKLGLLINFNVAKVRDGIHRVVNNL